ncbi:MAG: AAA family ATPase [Hyphomicrobiaceae bacterium]
MAPVAVPFFVRSALMEIMVTLRHNPPYEPHDEVARTGTTAIVTKQMQTDTIGQDEVIAFLKQPAAWRDAAHAVDIIETHGAIVFMAGENVLKIKRAVKLPYFDFSTLDRRQQFARRELEINLVNAPEIYRGVVAITREHDGSLAIGGSGVPVEWAIHMRRFNQDCLLSHVVEQHGLTTDLATAVADAVVRSHQFARPSSTTNDNLDAVADKVLAVLSTSTAPQLQAPLAKFSAAIRSALTASAAVRAKRVRDGHMRRCHGDLHLGNLVLWKGAPMLFDAIEFDEAIATIDTLYDLAFLLMDLERYGARHAAHAVLNRYLWKTGDPHDIEGLAALPFFMALRAGIRAMVTLDRARIQPDAHAELIVRAVETLHLGTALATPEPAQLTAIGGLSGTGKTTLAAMLAPHIGSAPGALHLRTDLERKWLAGVPEFDRLPESAYTLEASDLVIARVMARAKLALESGHSVVLDGVFARPAERLAVEDLARTAGVRFTGLWLEAPPEVMKARVTRRTHDASDATAAVVEKQLELDTGTLGWPTVDSSLAPPDLYQRALRIAGMGATVS